VIELAIALAILGLVVANAVFVAAEFAIVSAPHALLERHAEEGDRMARLAVDIQGDPKKQDRYIATAQLGITVASLGLGMLGERALAGWIEAALSPWEGAFFASHTAASIVAVGGLTYLHVVLGEMVPKSLALQSGDRVVRWVTPLVRATSLALHPVIVGLNALGNATLRLFGIERARAETGHSTAELARIVDESCEEGLLRDEPAHVVRELLDFGRLTAREVMVPRVRIAGLPLGATAAAVRETLRRAPHTRYPVFEGSLDRVVGMVHVKDVLRRLHLDEPLSRTSVRRVPFVPATTTVDDVLETMRVWRSQLAVVMDEHGGTAGIVTVEDLFEEVVGEITEDQGARSELFVDDAGRLHAAGTVRVEDLGAALGVSLEHEEVDTVSGLVLAELGRPPAVGDVVRWRGVRLDVVAVAGRGVGECLAAVEPPA
jgi:CBS domain containing-hemolysin-like protein